MISQHYLHLIKPGIVIGNLMSAIGGFLMASHGHVDYFMLINMGIGVSLIIASSCVLNNIIDRDIDAMMIRTKTRVLAQKHILSIKTSTLYAVILNILGFLFLGYTKNLIIIFLTIIGFFVYVNIYSLWMKRNSIYSIIVGSISGAMPPVIGYCTVTNQVDLGAVLLLLIFSFWQIPHSYAITIFRSHDYKIASIPTFVIQKGIKITRIHMIIYILGFTLTTILLTVKGYTSHIFLYIMGVMNLFWLYTGLYGYQSINNDILWSKKMFILSIIIVISLNILLSLDSIFIDVL